MPPCLRLLVRYTTENRHGGTVVRRAAAVKTKQRDRHGDLAGPPWTPRQSLSSTTRRWTMDDGRVRLGDPAPVKALYARSDDVLLANPFGGFSRGWDAVSQA